MDIRHVVQTLCKKYKTRNPYELADSLGIQVFFRNLGTVRGYYYRAHRVKLIYLHNNLPEYLERFVLAHEIGHSVMHPNSNTPFLQTTLFSVDKLEIEANKFAAELIISDTDLRGYRDYTISQIAGIYGLPVEIIELRLK